MTDDVSVTSLATDPKEKCSLLICDDSILSRKMISRLLQPHCSRCDMASDGEEAVTVVLEAMKQKDEHPLYDVIIIDLYMPKQCGPEAVQIMREHGYKGFVIGLTGAAQDEANSFISHGADIVMIKPFSPAELMSMIRNRSRQKE